MKAKLIKKGEHFYSLILFDNKEILATTEDAEGALKLSIHNCQAIERGYDLDELANKEYLDGYDTTNLCRLAFKDGFQKALEVTADKRFTLKEMVKCWNRSLEFQTHKETLGEYIKSLKQTEWDVEVEMVPALSNNGNVYYGDIPKLDENGCLILRRMSPDSSN